MRWSTYPMNAEVFWPKNEKIIGILGVAPLATSDFFHKLSARLVKKDWQHPRVLLDSNPKIPSRGRWLELHETDPVPFIANSVLALANAGADIVALPCNTAHILYPRYKAVIEQHSSVHLPDMIAVTAEATARALSSTPEEEQNPKVLILASQQVITHEIYTKALGLCGITAYPYPDQNLVNACIEAVKQGQHIQPWRERLLHSVSEFTLGVKGIIAGCTEISVLLHPEDFDDMTLIDSNQALADYCCNHCGARFGMH